MRAFFKAPLCAASLAAVALLAACNKQQAGGRARVGAGVPAGGDRQRHPHLARRISTFI